MLVPTFLLKIKPAETEKAHASMEQELAISRYSKKKKLVLQSIQVILHWHAPSLSSPRRSPSEPSM